MKNKTLLGLLLPSLIALAPAANAAENTADANRIDPNRAASYLGVIIGAGLPAGNLNSDSSTNLGITVGGRLTRNFGLGAWGTYYGQANSGRVFGLPVGTSSNNFNLAGQIKGYLASYFHFGADIGVAVNSWNASAGSLGIGNSNTALIYGPELGIDIPLGSSYPHASIGGEVHYLFTNAAGSQPNFLALAALKLWM